MTIRSKDETTLLKQEAERRARAGESRPDTSRALGIPLHTLSRWALEGGWRRKDIAAEGAAARTELIARRIALLRAGRQGGAEILEFKSADGRPGDLPPEASAPEETRVPYQPEPYPETEPEKPVPSWAPVLFDRNIDEEPEKIALWLARDLFLRGEITEAQKSLRFAASWLTISRKVWAVEEKQEASRKRNQARAERGNMPQWRWEAHKQRKRNNTTTTANSSASESGWG